MSQLLAFLLVIFFVLSIWKYGVVAGILNTVSGAAIAMFAYYVWFV